MHINSFTTILVVMVVSITLPGCKRSADGVTSQAELISSQPLHIARRRAEGETLFEELPSERTGLDFQMELYDPLEQIRVLMFLNANGGICTGDYDGDGLCDIYVTSPVGGNRLFRNLGDLRFEDVTVSAGMDDTDFWGTGATFVDIDNDGDLDIYACAYDMPNRLWINDGGRFSDQASRFGLNYRGASMTMAFADIDNDGDLDGYLATTALEPPKGTKFQVRFEGKKPVVLESLREYWDLIYLPGERVRRTESGQYDHLFRNDGDRFTEITKEAGIDGPYFSLSATWWDYDQNGFPDVYVSNDYLGPDQLYHNNGDGTFKEVLGDVVRHTPWFSMGSDIGDLNNDGLIDFFASDMSATSHYRDKVMMGNMEDTAWFLDFAEPRQYMRNAIYLNSGARNMMEVAFQTGLASSDWTWTPRLADFDNDGYIDVFTTNGILRDAMNADLSGYATKAFQGGSKEWAEFWAKQPMFKESNKAFRNLGGIKFKSIGSAWGLDRKGVSFGAATADFDNDGDLDLVVNNADAPMSLYENRAESGSRIRVHLQGVNSNRFGVGATVHVEVGDQKHVRYLTLARGWLSACEPALHFGLGDATVIDRMTVQWPSGHRQEFEQLPVNHAFTITEPSGNQPTKPRNAPERSMFQPSSEFSIVSHEENAFDDFRVQPLLPNRQSQFGPALALADIDGDHDVDVYLGGAAGKPGRLLLNHGTNFEASVPVAFDADANSEDVDALFFDADGDGDQDLYVVSGSNEWRPGSPEYQDRLYLNDGNGVFSRSGYSLPNLRHSGSCIVVADIDRDGDLDAFVGGRAKPGAYPLADASHVLVNNGQGGFTTKPCPDLQKLGIATDAVWADMNNDDQMDLVVTTEWGPVQILMNRDGQLELSENDQLGKRLGWWNAIDAGDIDGDGDMDLVVSNFGWNTKYKASHDHPELLYYGDLDQTGRPHIVEAKYDGERCLPRRGFSCSQNAMPFIKGKLKTFHGFASATLDNIYTQERLDQCLQFQANTLSHGILINQGADGGFEFRSLPEITQVAPCMDVALRDINGDGHLDLLMAQNFYSPQRETGRMAGGLSLLLTGNGQGDFEPRWAPTSGINLPHDTRRVATADIDGDGNLDLVFAANNGPLTVLLNQSAQ